MHRMLMEPTARDNLARNTSSEEYRDITLPILSDRRRRETRSTDSAGICLSKDRSSDVISGAHRIVLEKSSVGRHVAADERTQMGQ